MRIFLSTILLVLALANVTLAEETPVPRTIIAFYDGKASEYIETNIHTLVEMPLNHLGLKVEYYDIHKPLPEIASRKDVRGVLTWLYFDTKMENPEAYLKWALKAVESGKKYVIMGALGVMGNKNSVPSLALVNSFMGRLGMKMTHGWTETAFDVFYSYHTPEFFLTKEPFKLIRPAYETVLAISQDAKVHLSVKKGNSSEENSDLIITGPNGGYISSGYIINIDNISGKRIRQWVIDPFEFFRTTLGTDDLPKPDTTTIAGRRIYYSHIDGDGFNNVSQIEEYRDKQVLSAEVIMERAIKPYPELPVTLTVIAGDVDPKWAATDTSREVAKEFFALKNVEAGSHTYSHPFNWGFFKDGNANKEIPYLRMYPQASKYPVWKPAGTTAISSSFTNIFHKGLKPEAMPDGNATPRAFASEPFDINKEVKGSIDTINTLLPKNKKVEIMMWSGDCTPWEEALRATREAGIRNINGGDSIFDAQHPAYASVSGIGRKVGKEQQIYASTSNEIPYTNEWTQNFHAYQYLITTLKKTESPIRLKPLNIYYHLYSGEKESGLNALIANLDYAVKQNIAPITTSYYTHIAEGFYGTKITLLGPDVWSVANRGELATIRFDRSSFKSVDFRKSKGVIGQRHLNGSLYVYLDSAVAKPVVALKNNPAYFMPPQEDTAYLIESRWLVSNMVRGAGQLEFVAQGFGNGDMLLNVPSDGNYRIIVNGRDEGVATANGHQLKLLSKQNAMQPLRFIIRKV